MLGQFTDALRIFKYWHLLKKFTLERYLLIRKNVWIRYYPPVVSITSPGKVQNSSITMSNSGFLASLGILHKSLRVEFNSLKSEKSAYAKVLYQARYKYRRVKSFFYKALLVATDRTGLSAALDYLANFTLAESLEILFFFAQITTPPTSLIL
ncbi:hypothetical protein ACU8KH_01830 [Lachancea thermotolerans]